MNKCLTCGNECKTKYCNQKCYSLSQKLKEQAKNSKLILGNSRGWGKHKTNDKPNKSSFKKGMIPWNKGLKNHLSEKTKEKIRDKLRMWIGNKRYNYKGTTPELERLRKSSQYKLWRKEVFERDDYTCRFCGKRGGDLHADHEKPFAFFSELRFVIDNGRTLCEDCHRKTDTYGYKAGIKNG